LVDEEARRLVSSGASGLSISGGRLGGPFAMMLSFEGVNADRRGAGAGLVEQARLVWVVRISGPVDSPQSIALAAIDAEYRSR